MSFSLFHHDSLQHFTEDAKASMQFGHTFGGTLASHGIRVSGQDRVPHLLYRLNVSDPAVPVALPGVNWLPLCYGFSYAAFDGEFVYRVKSDTEIELILPAEALFDPDFPYPDYPREFLRESVAFRREPYDPTAAEDAVRLSAVFGLNQLSESEMQAAIQIVEKSSGVFSDRERRRLSEEDFIDMTPEEVIRYEYPAPFGQGAPLKSCSNPTCTAEIAYRSEPMTISLDGLDNEFADLVIELEARDVRVDTMKVFALHQPDTYDSPMWDSVRAQLVFEICDVCQCIRVSNQCD